MSFELQLEFTGLCLYVEHNDGRYTVLLPDCRKSTAPDKHLDETDAEFHVGFVCADAAYVNGAAQSVLGGSAGFEILHRFVGEEMSISGLSGEAVTGLRPAVPTFDSPNFDDLAVSREQFGETPNGLLLRLSLSGGKFESNANGGTWEVPGWLNAAGAVQSSSAWSGLIKWKAMIHDDALALRLRRFRTSEADATTIPLRPTLQAGSRIVVRIANVCAYNPMRWEDLKLRDKAAETEDPDFKWLYRLLQSTAPDDLRKRAMNAKNTKGAGGLPFPRFVRSAAGPRSNRYCMGGHIKAGF